MMYVCLTTDVIPIQNLMIFVIKLAFEITINTSNSQSL